LKKELCVTQDAGQDPEPHMVQGVKESTMKRKNLFLMGSLVAFLCILTSQECLAGVVVEQVVRDREGSPSKVLFYISDYRFRTDHPDGGLTTILNFKEDRLVMIDHRSKSYIEVKLSKWEREVARRLKEQSPGVTPKERKMAVRRTGRTAVINGFQTEQIEILADNELIEENWVTRNEETKEIEKVMDLVAQGFSKDFRLEMKEGREIYEKLKPYGFPILIKDYTMTYGLGGIDRVEVKKMEKKELKEEIFLSPAGYQKIVPEPSKK
jgi:hypothetical protein